MMTITLKRTYEAAQPTDGYRILADRLWPRGIKKETFALDLWAKDVAPSTELRKEYHQHQDFELFKAAYLKELNANPAVEDFLNTISEQPHITLLTAVKEVARSELPILKAFIEQRLGR